MSPDDGEPPLAEEVRRSVRLALEWYRSAEQHAPETARGLVRDTFRAACDQALLPVGGAKDTESRFLTALSDEIKSAVVEVVRQAPPVFLHPPQAPGRKPISSSPAVMSVSTRVRDSPDLETAFRRALLILHATVISAHGVVLVREAREFGWVTASDLKRLADAADKILEATEGMCSADPPPGGTRDAKGRPWGGRPVVSVQPV